MSLAISGPIDSFTTESASRFVAGPDARLAMDLAQAVQAGQGLAFIDASSSRLDNLARLAAVFAPELEVLVLPAWDSLPYDRVPPSAAVMGQRVATLARLAEAPGAPRLLLTSARAALQFVPKPAHWADALLRLAVGDGLEDAAFRECLARFGYQFDEHVDRPGEVAVRGHVIDVFPGGASLPVRLEVEDGRIKTLHAFEPASQRSCAELDSLVLRPVMEIEPEPEQVAAEAERIAHPDKTEPEAEPGNAEPVPPPSSADLSSLQASLFDYLVGMPLVLHHAVIERWHDIAEQVHDAYAAARLAARALRRGVVLPSPERLYVPVSALQERLERWRVETLGEESAAVIPAARSLAELVKQIEAGASNRIVIAAGAQASAMASALARRGVRRIATTATWQDAVVGAARVACLDFELSEGFARDGVRVLAAPALASAAPGKTVSARPVEEPPRLSDIAVHADHGVCRLSGLRRVGEEERVALEFYEGTELLIPIDELRQVWRYGTEAGHIALDRLHGEAWYRRRAENEAKITETATALAQAAARRASTRAPVIKPPAAAFNRVVDRFAFAPSPDQQAAIDAVLADLQAGRPMDRLVCGDVGFGKTEVALRATIAVALAGYQVAIVAPTTVLARQHLDSFRKRLGGTGVRVEPVMRGSAADAVRAGLRDGSIGVVIGTSALASDKVRFAKLGLVVIDEEQRFGEADKRKLTELRNRDGAVHALVMSATPIPRTLQAAMVGLRDISVIATPPVRRQPTRTLVLPFEQGLVREALLREHGRGGQSFVVAPRIEDLAPLAARLKEWVPEMSVATAHGRLKPEVLEDLVAEFADGRHDVLLATNIIEAGLDIPRANTILVTGPHRFGLAQLHQMRGRVGRGSRRGMAYVLTDPAARLAPSTARRLRTLETLEGLGAGVGIAVADMDTRGAGELFGEAQAGHVHAIGTELYQHILARELARIEGRPPAPQGPQLHADIVGRLPEEYVPESNVRLELYRRLARLADPEAADDLMDEVSDRFGGLPPEFARLLTLARLRIWCQAQGVITLKAGPQAVALTTHDPEAAQDLARSLPGAAVKESRVLLPIAVADPVLRLERLWETLTGTPADSPE